MTQRPAPAAGPLCGHRVLEMGSTVADLLRATAYDGRPGPAAFARGASMTDYTTGLYSAFGAVMALLVRGNTGRGQLIDSALYECAFSFMEPYIPAFEKLGHVAKRTGSRLPDSTPNNLYVSRDQQFIHITAMGHAVFKRLLGCMGVPDLAADARFRDAVDRSHNHEQIDDIIARWAARHDLAELEEMLHVAGVPATRIFTIADIFCDPHYHARGMLAAAPDDELGSVTMAAPMPRMSGDAWRHSPRRQTRGSGHPARALRNRGAYEAGAGSPRERRHHQR